MKTPHVLIAGAGIGGLTASLTLAKHGAKVEVFEQASELGEIGAGLQLSANAMQVLARLGLSPGIEAAGFEPDAIIFRHYKSGKPYIKTPLKSDHATRYGQKYIHIHRADLHSLFSGAAKKSGVNIHLGTKVQSYSQTDKGVTLTTDKGKHLGGFLIGADGIHSRIRDQMLGEEKPRFTGMTAWRGLVPADSLSDDLIPKAANNWMGPGKHFVAYYVRGGTLINFVAVEEHEAWTEESWSQKGDINALRESFAGWDPRITTLLETCDETYLWGLFDRDPLTKWTDGRVAILGDASHPMLPFMAQGAAMAIEDAWILAHQILTAGSLSSYETARLPRTTQLQTMSRANAKLFHTASPHGLAFRKLKLGIGSAVPTLVNAQLGKVFGVNVTEDFPL